MTIIVKKVSEFTMCIVGWLWCVKDKRLWFKRTNGAKIRQLNSSVLEEVEFKCKKLILLCNDFWSISKALTKGSRFLDFRTQIYGSSGSICHNKSSIMHVQCFLSIMHVQNNIALEWSGKLAWLYCNDSTNQGHATFMETLMDKNYLCTWLIHNDNNDNNNISNNK